MPGSLTPDQRSLRSRLASFESWANTSDPAERTAPARLAALARFELAVDPQGVLPAEERSRRAEAKRRAHFTRLALLSSQARSKAGGKP